MSPWPPLVTDQRVTVIGGARSGRAAARLLARKGAQVFLTDRGAGTDDLRADLDAAGVAYEFGGHTARAEAADFVVISPGVPTTAPLVQTFLQRGVPVYSEIEVASWYADGPIVAITGTNGKTTTTALTGYLFDEQDRRRAAPTPDGRQPVVVGGNIGTAFADLVDAAAPGSVFVLEVSSFQLDHIARFRPKVGVLLNITPDHMDRYEHSLEQYAAAKFRLFENQGPGDVLIYNHDDDLVRDACLRMAAAQGVTALGFSFATELEQGAFVRDGALVLRLPDPSTSILTESLLMQSNELALRGRHNLYNSLAAAIAARAMEIRSDVVRESLMTFEGVPHRLELVREVNGVKFVNDSKATNVNAVWYALESFQEPLILIAGGRDKGNDYTPIKPLVHEKVRGVVGLGESGDRVLLELGPEVKHTARAYSMAEAIQYAQLIAEPGDVVLLSPACASFDLYTNYEERGNDFKRLVNGL